MFGKPLKGADELLRNSDCWSAEQEALDLEFSRFRMEHLVLWFAGRTRAVASDLSIAHAREVRASAAARRDAEQGSCCSTENTGKSARRYAARRAGHSRITPVEKDV